MVVAENGRVLSIAVFVLPTTPLYDSDQNLFAMAKQRANPVRIRPIPTRAVRAGPGRPPVHNETWSKVSVVLFDRQILHFDRLATSVRGRGGKLLNRAEIIRALIDGLIDSGMDITGTASEKDLRARVARRLSAPYR
jgi:hypothetical protein